MTKFHVNAKGIPAPCKATKGNCPFGGSTGTENHFNSIEEAQEFADSKNEKQYGLINTNSDIARLQELNDKLAKNSFSQVFEMKDIDEALASRSPKEILDMKEFGEFNKNHKYFEINDYGNLTSYESLDEVVNLYDDVE